LTGAKAEAAPRLSKRAKIVRKGAILIAIVGNAIETTEKNGKNERNMKQKDRQKGIVKLRDVGSKRGK
jgi:hypothetical protein